MKPDPLVAQALLAQRAAASDHWPSTGKSARGKAGRRPRPTRERPNEKPRSATVDPLHWPEGPESLVGNGFVTVGPATGRGWGRFGKGTIIVGTDEWTPFDGPYALRAIIIKKSEEHNWDFRPIDDPDFVRWSESRVEDILSYKDWDSRYTFLGWEIFGPWQYTSRTLTTFTNDLWEIQEHGRASSWTTSRDSGPASDHYGVAASDEDRGSGHYVTQPRSTTSEEGFHAGSWYGGPRGTEENPTHDSTMTEAEYEAERASEAESSDADDGEQDEDQGSGDGEEESGEDDEEGDDIRFPPWAEEGPSGGGGGNDDDDDGGWTSDGGGGGGEGGDEDEDEDEDAEEFLSQFEFGSAFVMIEEYALEEFEQYAVSFFQVRTYYTYAWR